MKFPQIKHLTFSPGVSRDDKRLKSQAELPLDDLIITEKMDGSNVCLRHDGVYGRSHNGAPGHESFDALKALWASIAHRIPVGISIYGEWCYAKHSIHYKNMPAYLFFFAVHDDTAKIWRSWKEVEDWAEDLSGEKREYRIAMPLYWDYDPLDGPLDDKLRELESEFKDYRGGEIEGFVVRKRGQFVDKDWDKNVAKYVRAGHVQTDEHWREQEIVRNELSVDKSY